MKWILCENQMPCEKDGELLIALENGDVKTATYSEFSNTWYFGQMCGVAKELIVVAWMQFPKYPLKNES